MDEGYQRAKEGLSKAQKKQKLKNKRDYYKILGVKKTATKKEINKAYRYKSSNFLGSFLNLLHIVELNLACGLLRVERDVRITVGHKDPHALGDIASVVLMLKFSHIIVKYIKRPQI